MNQLRILVVDDDYDVRSSLQTVLEIEGYDVRIVGGGTEALQVLRESTELPDLILLDLMMPVMTGYEFVQIVRSDERLRGVPILVSSAGTLKEPLVDVQGFLPKPVQLEDLLESCKKLIQNHRQNL